MGTIYPTIPMKSLQKSPRRLLQFGGASGRRQWRLWWEVRALSGSAALQSVCQTDDVFQHPYAKVAILAGDGWSPIWPPVLGMWTIRIAC